MLHLCSMLCFYAKLHTKTNILLGEEVAPIKVIVWGKKSHGNIQSFCIYHMAYTTVGVSSPKLEERRQGVE